MFSVFVDAVIERDMSMTGASMYWLDALHGCNLDRSLALPYDRYRLVDEQRTGRSRSVTLDFGEDLSHAFLACASANSISPQHLALACYYVFLFKLTNGERDLCVGMSVNTRYRDELQSVIGLFENTIPLRCQMDPNLSFGDLTKYVAEMMERSVTYSYFPLQCILAQHPNSSKPAFLDTSFGFSVVKNQNRKEASMIGNARLDTRASLVKIGDEEIASNFDLALMVELNSSTNQFSCTMDASLDLFDMCTTDKIAQRFRAMVEDVIGSEKLMYESSLVLPDEHILTQSMNNTQMLCRTTSCTHHEFIRQALDQPQKLAVELDDQSLSYSELLHYAQVLSLDFLNERKVLVGDVICQCVERSLSMVCCSTE